MNELINLWLTFWAHPVYMYVCVCVQVLGVNRNG